MQILLVEDDELIAKGLTYSFKQNGYNLVHKTNIKDTSNFLQNEKIEFIILDISLPDGNGLDLYNNIIKKLNIPTIFLTAKDDEETIVKGLELGAEDYITKPFDIEEVVARVQIQLRHAGREQAPDRISCGEISLEKGTHQIWIGGKELEHLTRQEFAILELLLEHPGQVFSKEAIFTYAWQEEYMGETKTLDVHISNIRKKLKSLTEKEYIQTVWGIGYRLQPSK